MTKRKKRLDRIRQNPKNVTLGDLQRILEDYGFVLERIEGSHHHFSYVLNGQKRLLTVPGKRPLNQVYVKEAIKIIDRLVEAEGDDDAE